MKSFRVVYVQFPNGVKFAEALTATDENGFLIVIDDSLPETRKRFLLRHEIAHIHLCHFSRSRNYGCIGGGNRDYHMMEKEADRFAVAMSDSEFAHLMRFCVSKKTDA